MVLDVRDGMESKYPSIGFLVYLHIANNCKTCIAYCYTFVILCIN